MTNPLRSKLLHECETEEEQIEAIQGLINSGLAWRLEGSVGRLAMSYLEQGLCELGEVGYRDYWGNYVPSKYEVKPGTKGSPLSTRKEVR